MRTLAPLLLIASLGACTPGNGPLYVKQITASAVGMVGGCATNKETITSLGVVDVAAPPEVEISAELGGLEEFFGATSQRPVVVTGGQVLSSTGREHLLVQNVFLRYASKPGIPGLTPGAASQAECLAKRMCDLVPRTLLLNRESSISTFMQVPLFGANAREKLAAAISPSNADAYQFTVTFEIQGVTEPGGVEFRTPPVPVPLTLVKSEVICTSADTRLRRFTNTDPNKRACNFIGAKTRFTPADCCNLLDANGVPALDLATPGCDVAAP
ncbi:MAG: hypothetical protein IAE78_29260 [Myxococcus sp.]|nr:hypothetical protein [Myxococcus sp.]